MTPQVSALPSAAVPPGTAERLARTARGLARAGATPASAASRAGAPEALRGELRTALALPDRRRGFRVVTGLLAGFADPGPTPPHWRGPQSAEADAIDLALALATSALGRLYGWAHQQDGRLVHNILPIPGHEDEQVGASSATLLTRHTEDAFHPLRPHLLVLAVMRNPEGVGSSVSSVRRAALSAEDRARLSRPLVTITPDDSYAPPEGAASWREVEGPRTPVLWAADDGLCLRYDPAYSVLPDDPGFLGSYDALEKALQDCEEEVPLGPGDVILIDNDVAAHGRRPFRARYDGTDRWLKRAIIGLDRPRPAAEAAEPGYGQRTVEPEAAR